MYDKNGWYYAKQRKAEDKEKLKALKKLGMPNVICIDKTPEPIVVGSVVDMKVIKGRVANKYGLMDKKYQRHERRK